MAIYLRVSFKVGEKMSGNDASDSLWTLLSGFGGSSHFSLSSLLPSHLSVLL